MFIQKVVKTLEKHKVKYALIGGYAVALHGAVRGTVDIDLVISLNEKAFKSAELAMQSIGLQSRLPVSASEVFHFRQEYIENRNLQAWSFVNPNLPSEIVDIVITHGLDEIKVINKKIGALTIKIASIEDLIRMKRLAHRPQDLEDIKALEKLK